LLVVLVGLAASAMTQAPKKTNPELSDSFAKTGLKALQAIGEFKGMGSLTGPAKAAFEAMHTEARSTSSGETLMVANLLDFAIMRSTDNLARENIIVKATAKLDRDGTRSPNSELSAALEAINKRESECSTSLEKAFRDRIAIPLPGACASSK
jgi:hypothetical protein